MHTVNIYVVGRPESDRQTPFGAPLLLNIMLLVLSGCEKDTDCKGDRICEQGLCVSPTQGSVPETPAPVREEPAARTGCVAGQVESSEHCCWRAQTWSRVLRRCVGVPVCPPGALVEAELCVAANGERLASGVAIDQGAAPVADLPQPPSVSSVLAPAVAAPVEKSVVESAPVSRPQPESPTPALSQPNPEPPTAEAKNELSGARPFVSLHYDWSEGLPGMGIGHVGLFRHGVGFEFGLIAGTAFSFLSGRALVWWATGGVWLGLRFSSAAALSFSTAFGPAGILRSGDIGRLLVKVEVGGRFEFRISKNVALFIGYNVLVLNGTAHVVSIGNSFQ